MKLSTHILNTTNGLPAANVDVVLRAVSPTGETQTLATVTTDNDGRSNITDNLEPGSYELQFAVGAYFEQLGSETLYPQVTIAFAVDGNGPEKLHVPLLLSPFGYSTYRGS